MPPAAPPLPGLHSASVASNARRAQRSRQRSASSLSAEPGRPSATAGCRSFGPSAAAAQSGEPSVSRCRRRRAGADRRAGGLDLADDHADVWAGRAASPARSVSEGDLPARAVDHAAPRQPRRQPGAAVDAVGPAAADGICDGRTTTLPTEVIDLTDPDLTWTASSAAGTGGQLSNETETGPDREVFAINVDSEDDIVHAAEDDDVIFVSSNRRTPPRDLLSQIRFHSGSSLLDTDVFRIMMDAAIRTSESLSSRTIAGGPAPGEIRLDYSLAGRGFRQLELSPPDETNDRSRLPPMPAPKPAPAYVRRLEPLGYTRNSMLEVYVDIAESGEIGEQGLESVTQPAGGSVGMSLPSESSLPASASRPCATHPKVKRRRADEANVGHDGTLLAAAAAGHGGSSQSDTLPAKKRRKIVVPGRIKCPICLRMPESGWHTTRCGHVFCDECISNVKSAKKCAACQSNVKPKDVRKLFL